MHKKSESRKTRLMKTVAEGRLLGSADLFALLDLDGDGGFAEAVAEVVEAGAHRLGGLLDLDLLDVRGAGGEHALDALAVADATDGEGLVDARALQGDDDAGENLDALFITLAHLGVHFDAVAHLERREVFFDLAGGDFFDDRVAHDG